MSEFLDQIRDGTLDLNGGVDAQNMTSPGNVRVDQVPASTEKAPDSLRDQLTEAFNPQKADGAVSKPANIELKLENGSYHRVDGTFASADEIEAFKALNTQQEAATPAIPNFDNIVSGFTPLEQEQFKSLPMEMQQFVARTMQGVNERTSLYSEYDMMEQLIGPRRQAFAQDGLTAPVAMAQLFQLSDFAAANPGEFVLWFCGQRGIDIDELLDNRDAGLNIDPTVQALQQQVNTLTNQLQTRETSAQQAIVDNNRKVVDTFAEEKDANGNVMRPYFAELATSIPMFIPQLQQTHPNKSPSDILQIAYENACWANPTVRAKMQQQTTIQPQAEKVQKAKNASGSIDGSNVGDTSKSAEGGNRSLREEIEMNMARFG